MARFGNANASSLLTAANAAYTRQQTYNDSIQGYQFDLSAKTPEDFNSYQDYLKGRLKNTTDPTKALTLQKTLTSAYRSFNSSEIGRQTTAVKYGDQSNRDKYAHMVGLYQAAVQNGDENLAQSIDSQLASLSVTIQNEDIAAANAAQAAGARAKASSDATATAQINELSAKIDRAYQTGQPLVVGGVAKMMNGADYAVNQAQILQAKHNLLTQQAATDPSKIDDIAKLEASSDYKNLIDSGLVQFDANNQPIVDPKLQNVAVSFKTDPHTGTVSRDYSFVAPDGSGKAQYGLVKQEGDNSKLDYVANHVLGDQPGSIYGRVKYDTQEALDAQGNKIKIGDNNVRAYTDPIGAYKGKLIGNQLVVDPATGLRAVQTRDKNGIPGSQDQAISDLKNLTAPATYDSGGLNGLLDTLHGASTSPFAKSVNKGISRVVSFISGGQDYATKKAQIAQQAAAVQAKQSADLLAAANAQNRTLPAIRAVQPAGAPRAYVPTAPASQLYLPTPVGQTPAQVFKAALPANATDAQKAQAIGKSVGYNF
jgi:hypothetical protein